ncbi:YbaB/EbfC family nucleoid-associated protein [Nocardia higoensis]|uniref:YbaB/EbfC family nucleoid-associated protein n=1 Tax=Nocardia higoensis TaxID=228599 RepID=UPI0003012737|nr:YbaB/EbfC family nucleoid-associated protein [Nocardia higoensis]
MSNEHARTELAAILDETREQLRMIAGIQRARAALIGTGSSRRHRVTVSVNADGTVIETKFGHGIEDLSHAEIAKAVTEAAQQAARHLAEQHAALMDPVRERRARLPKLTDLIEDMPDFDLPEAPKPTPTPPKSLDRPAPIETDEPRYSDVEERQEPSTRRVTESGW